MRRVLRPLGCRRGRLSCGCGAGAASMTLRLLAALCALPLATGNVLLVSDAYCDVGVYARDASAPADAALPAPAAVLRMRSATYVLGNLGRRLEFRLRDRPEELLQTFDVPQSAPRDGDLGTHRATLHIWKGYPSRVYYFSRFHASGQNHSCLAPEPREPADSQTALLVLGVAASLVLLSAFNSRPEASKSEFYAWVALFAAYSAYGFYRVFEASERYRQFAIDERLDTNPYEGDKVWGLFGDTPMISAFFGGRRWDRKDIQWRELVNNFNLILLLVLLHLGVRLALCRPGSSGSRLPRLAAAPATLLTAAAYLGFLHEATVLLPLGFALVHFVLIRGLAALGRFGVAVIPLATWIFGLSAIAISGSGSLSLTRAFAAVAGEDGRRLGATLDGFKGEVPWAGMVSLLVLRLISWAVDFQRSQVAKGDAKKTDDLASGDEERRRADTHRPPADYRSLGLYLAYLFYPPLYVTGPIITFNAFVSYLEVPQRQYVGRDLLKMWARCFMNLFLFTAFGHFLYTSALMVNGRLNSNSFSRDTIYDKIFHYGQDGEDLVWYSFWSLKWLWFKFLVVWRIARAWALTDGVCPPENMNRCMCNNFTVRGFWRAWHRSFNRWLVRYIFIPLGGSRGVSVIRQLGTIAAVFTFVAVWHEPTILFGDREKLKLLVWGWLFVLFQVPEVLTERFLRHPTPKAFLEARPLLRRHLTALGGTVCIHMLFLANLIGYSYGVEGARVVLRACQKWSMVIFLLAHAAWLFAGVQIMLVIRDREAVCAGGGKIAAKDF
eukprot:TRINITY_DN26353_c0_g1_i1.p1 TRINITY_DN26353_c0_g1~~TRINITY_DN26353_c0_g1_i1.p1  ORF type:complete len:794 (-),score=154.18 TRINITY_DN26353_c0_g1_i1:50-2389(-)